MPTVWLRLYERMELVAAITLLHSARAVLHLSITLFRLQILTPRSARSFMRLALRLDRASSRLALHQIRRIAARIRRD